MARGSNYAVGVHIGRLTILSHVGTDRSRYRLWLCRCDCGREETLATYRIRRVPMCTACRSPPCVICGGAVAGRGRSKTCSSACRRALVTRQALDWRRREYATDQNFRAATLAYNQQRLTSAPAALEAKRKVDRQRYERNRDDPEWTERERLRWTDYYDRRRQTPEYREERREKSARQRRQRELDSAVIELATIGETNE